MSGANDLITKYVQKRGLDFTVRANRYDMKELLSLILIGLTTNDLVDYYKLKKPTVLARIETLYKRVGVTNRIDLMADFITFLEDELYESNSV